MSRETKRANLKKLQLPSSSTTISRKGSSSISTYFATPNKLDVLETTPTILVSEHEETENATSDHVLLPSKRSCLSPEKKNTPKTKAKRTKMTYFLRCDEDDFEDGMTMMKPVVPKPKRPVKASGGKSKPKRHHPKQRNIKSAFLRNEELFAEITAQHCIADNFSPEDVKLALAISQSEADAQQRSPCMLTMIDDDVVVNLVDHKSDVISNDLANETIRTKLKKYGFRTGNREDYNNLAAAFIPGINNRARSKTKWGNKFTALTLRNPEHQIVKLKSKIDELLALQYKTKVLQNNETPMDDYLVNSSLLKNIHVSTSTDLVLKSYEAERSAPLSSYFVETLFEISNLPVGHLLKKWENIQGRDFSPPRTKNDILERMENAYAKLQVHLNSMNKDLRKAEESLEFMNQRILLANNDNEDFDCNVNAVKNEVQCSKLSPKSMKRSPIKILTEPLVAHEECISYSNTVEREKQVSHNISSNPKETSPIKVFSRTPSSYAASDAYKLPQLSETRSSRCESPDLFADSDVEDRDGLENNFTEPANPMSPEPELTTMMDHTKDKIELDTIEKVSIDLTQDEEDDFKQKATVPHDAIETLYNTFLEMENMSSSNESLFEGHIPPRSPIRAWDASKAMSFNRKNQDGTAFKSTSLSSPQYSRDQFHWRKSSINLTPCKPSLQRRTKSASLIRSESLLSLGNALSRELSIDLTQSDEEQNYENHTTNRDDVKDDCIMLSDDEINYSIWRANRTCNANLLGYEKFRKIDIDKDVIGQKDISILDLFDCNKSLPSSDSEGEKLFGSSTAMASSAINTQDKFGILDNYCDIDYNNLNSPPEINMNTISFATSSQKYLTRKTKSLKYNLPAPSALTKPSRTNQAEFGILDSNSDIDTNNLTSPDVEMSIVSFSKSSQKYMTRKSKSLKYNLSRPSATISSVLTTPSRTNQAEFGILDSNSDIDTNNLTSPDVEMSIVSFSKSDQRESMKYYAPESSSSIKCALEDFDEFDKLIYGTPERKIVPIQSTCSRTPSGLDKLLTGDISFIRDSDKDQMKERKMESHESQHPVITARNTESFILSSGKQCTPLDLTYLTNGGVQDVIIDGYECTVEIMNKPKPDYTTFTESELHRVLYKFGIKPLKRKNAVKILEYIYAQTHMAIDLDSMSNNKMNNITEADGVDSDPAYNVIDFLNAKYGLSQHLPNQECNSVYNSGKYQRKASKSPLQHTTKLVNSSKSVTSSQFIMSSTESGPVKADQVIKFNFQDCSGDNLKRDEMESSILLLFGEEFILQTNVTKKTPRPLLPFHIAWYNLVCSSAALHEAILCFEPIDLQEVHLFLKGIGYRYEAKDMKLFFDRRSIIFRYDLNGMTNKVQQSRQLKKKKKRM